VLYEDQLVPSKRIKNTIRQEKSPYREYRVVVNVCYILGCNRDNQSMTYLFGSIQIRCVRSSLSKKWVEITCFLYAKQLIVIYQVIFDLAFGILERETMLKQVVASHLPFLNGLLRFHLCS
jgi:hypothetical protein